MIKTYDFTDKELEEMGAVIVPGVRVKNEQVKVTRENIQSFLKTRRDNVFYFKFPDLSDIILNVEIDDLVIYHTEYNSDLIRDEIYDKAWKAYQKKKENSQKDIKQKLEGENDK